MNYAKVERVSLGLIAVFMLPAGLQGVLHLVFHVSHLDGYDTVDKIGLIGSLVSVPALALVALWAGRQQPSNGTT